MSLNSDDWNASGIHWFGIDPHTLIDDGQVHHLPTFVQIPMLSFAHLIGMPSSVCVFVVCQILSVPLGFLHKRLHGKFSRHVYSACVGALFAFIIFGWTVMHLFALCTLVYLLVPHLPDNYAQCFVFAIAMTWLSVTHYQQMMYHFGVWSMNTTALLMVAVVKLITFACNYDDSVSLKHSIILHSNPRIAAVYEARALHQYPTPLEFASYILFYATVATGPVFGIREYLDFQNQSVFQKDGFDVCPASLWPCLQTIVYALCSYAGVVASGYFVLSGVVDEPEFLHHAYVYRLVYTLIGVVLYRMRYYVAWYLAEASCIACGFGFKGNYTNQQGFKSIDWSRCNNVRVLAIESGSHVHQLTDHWNTSVSDFLKYYVYFRVSESAPLRLCKLFGGQRSFAMLTTRVTSALWHGFYLPYYMFFVSVILVNEVDRLLRHHIEPLTLDKQGKSLSARSFFYHAFCKFITFTCMNYFGASFTLLVGPSAWAVWRASRFYGHIVCTILIVTLRLSFSRPSKPIKED